MANDITLERIDGLRPWSRNARTHSKKQIRQIAESIETFGFNNPVLIDEERRILAGHGRVAAARLLGRERVPCLLLDHMTPAQKRAYVVADNRLAELAGWDNDLLAVELGELAGLDLGFELTTTGFDAGAIDTLIEGAAPNDPAGAPDDVLPALSEVAVTCHGDLWQLARHRLVCGDARDQATYAQLLGVERAEMVFADPPYNVRIDGHVGNSGRIQHREFAMASGEMSSTEFTRFLTVVLQQMADHSVDGSIHFQCMDWRHMAEMLAAGTQVYTELKNLIVWAKDNGGMGSFYRSRHELIFVFKNGRAPHINTFGLGQSGRYRTNVWEYRGVNSRGAGRLDDLALHPTVKPVAMLADALRDCSTRGGIVLDAFGGSGSTLIAAERTQRQARLIEIDPIYVDRTILRWQAIAKDEAVLAATGETFAEVQARRAGPANLAQSGPPPEGPHRSEAPIQGELF